MGGALRTVVLVLAMLAVLPGLALADLPRPTGEFTRVGGWRYIEGSSASCGTSVREMLAEVLQRFRVVQYDLARKQIWVNNDGSPLAVEDAKAKMVFGIELFKEDVNGDTIVKAFMLMAGFPHCFCAGRAK